MPSPANDLWTAQDCSLPDLLRNNTLAGCRPYGRWDGQEALTSSASFRIELRSPLFLEPGVIIVVVVVVRL